MLFLLFFFPFTFFFVAALTQFPTGIIKVSSDFYLISISAWTHTHMHTACDISRHSFYFSENHLLLSSPESSNHKSLTSVSTLTGTFWILDLPPMSQNMPWPGLPWHTLQPTVVLLFWLVGWTLWNHLVSVCCLNPPSSSSFLCACFCTYSPSSPKQLNHQNRFSCS